MHPKGAHFAPLPPKGSLIEPRRLSASVPRQYGSALGDLDPRPHRDWAPPTVLQRQKARLNVAVRDGRDPDCERDGQNEEERAPWQVQRPRERPDRDQVEKVHPIAHGPEVRGYPVREERPKQVPRTNAHRGNERRE